MDAQRLLLESAGFAAVSIQQHDAARSMQVLAHLNVCQSSHLLYTLVGVTELVHLLQKMCLHFPLHLVGNSFKQFLSPEPVAEVMYTLFS